MSAETARQLEDGFGRLLELQYYDEATDTYKPGGNPGGGGGGGGGDATAANQVAVIGSKTGGTAAASSQLAGGVYRSTLPTLTDGQQAGVQVDERGSMRVRLHATSFTATDGLSVTIAAVSGANDSTGGNRPLAAAQYVFNGTSFDRMRGNNKGTFVVGAPLTNTNRSAAIGTSTTVLAAANATRSGFVMQNLSASADIWYAFGIPAVVGGLGCFKLAPGGTFFMESNVIDTAAINVIASAVATNLSALEY